MDARGVHQQPADHAEDDVLLVNSEFLPIIEQMRAFGRSWLIDDHDHEHVERRPRAGTRS